MKIIREVVGEKCEVRVIREMTKKFEEIKKDAIGEVKGEVVITFE